MVISDEDLARPMTQPRGMRAACITIQQSSALFYRWVSNGSGLTDTAEFNDTIFGIVTGKITCFVTTNIADELLPSRPVATKPKPTLDLTKAVERPIGMRAAWIRCIDHYKGRAVARWVPDTATFGGVVELVYGGSEHIVKGKIEKWAHDAAYAVIRPSRPVTKPEVKLPVASLREAGPQPAGAKLVQLYVTKRGIAITRWAPNAARVGDHMKVVVQNPDDNEEAVVQLLLHKPAGPYITATCEFASAAERGNQIHEEAEAAVIAATHFRPKYPKKPEPLPITESNMDTKIEVVTYINGLRAKDMSNAQLFDHIRTIEEEIEQLRKIKRQPTRLKAEIAKKEADLDKLVKLMDEIDNDDKKKEEPA